MQISGASFRARLSPYAWIAAICVLAGSVLRIQHYLYNPSLWLDEASLALNFIERPLTGIFEHLDYGQLAPIGFLVPTKIVSDLTMASEQGLRFVPLLAGILLLALLYPAGRHISPLAAMVATGICAFSKSLIYFSVTVKPYESDALMAILYVWMGVALLEPRPSNRQLTIVALGGAAGFWCSFPAIFVALGVVAMVLPLPLIRRDLRWFTRVFVVFAVWGLSFLLSFAYARLQLRGDEDFMYGFWDEYFLAWPLDASWLTTLVTAFDNPTGVVFKEIAAILALIGLVWLVARRSPYAILLSVPVVVAWGASLAQAYPFFERLILYIAPLFALLVGCGVAATADVVRRVGRVPFLPAAASALLLILLLTRPVLGAAYRAQTNETFYGFDVRQAAAYFKANRQPEDFLYVHWLVAGAYRYYGYRLNIDRGRLREGPINGTDSWTPTLEDVAQYANVPRMWFMAPDLPPNDTDIFAGYLKSKGEQIDFMKSRAINLWLFRLN